MGSSVSHRPSGALLALLALVGVGHARPPAPVTPPSDAACGAGDWRLVGAAVRPGPGSTFKPEWQSALVDVERCLGARPDACVRVRGHYDATAFDPAVVHAFGSAQAAQLARARGRSEQVVARLYDLGVHGERLQHVPPPMQPSWRGVSLTLVERCRPAASAPPPIEAPEPQPPEPQPPEPPPAAPQPPPPEPAAFAALRAATRPVHAPPPLALTGALGGGVLAIQGAAEWSTGLRIGLEWRNPGWYAQLAGGVSLSDVDARARGGDLVVGAGHRPLSWLAVGLFAAVGQGSTGFTDAWMHRTWAVGLEAAECFEVYPGGRVCAEQRLSPLGRRTQRALLVDGVTFLVPQETDDTLGLGLTVGFRQQL